MNRNKVPVFEHHRKVIRVLTLLQVSGGITVVFGVYKLDLCLTLAGTVLVYLSKMWFLDRMVWVYQEMKDHPEYRSMLRDCES